MSTGRSRMCILLAAWHAVSGVSPVIITSCDTPIAHVGTEYWHVTAYYTGQRATTSCNDCCFSSLLTST